MQADVLVEGVSSYPSWVDAVRVTPEDGAYLAEVVWRDAEAGGRRSQMAFGVTPMQALARALRRTMAERRRA